MITIEFLGDGGSFVSQAGMHTYINVELVFSIEDDGVLDSLTLGLVHWSLLSQLLEKRFLLLWREFRLDP